MKWTPDKSEELQRLWLSALTLKGLAFRFGVSTDAIRKRARIMGLRPRSLNPRSRRDGLATKARAVELVAAGKSRSEIAAELHTTAVTLNRWLGTEQERVVDIQFAPERMKYDEYQAAWIAAAGPINTPLFRNIRCSDFGKPPSIETHVPRCA